MIRKGRKFFHRFKKSRGTYFLEYAYFVLDFTWNTPKINPSWHKRGFCIASVPAAGAPATCDNP